jgi:hypothetical protein
MKTYKKYFWYKISDEKQRAAQEMAEHYWEKI